MKGLNRRKDTIKEVPKMNKGPGKRVHGFIVKKLIGGWKKDLGGELGIGKRAKGQK